MIHKVFRHNQGKRKYKIMSTLTRMRFMNGGGMLRGKIFHIFDQRSISAPALKKNKMVRLL